MATEMIGGRASRFAAVLCCAGTLVFASLRTARAEVDPAVIKAENDRVAVVARASAAAVAIFADGGRGGGSGVVISPDGYALSNFHVVAEVGVGMKCGMADGRLYDGVIVGIDPTGDLALIKLLGRDDFPFAPLADSDQVEVGDWCFAIGNPFLLATDFHPTVSYGVVSGVHRYQYPEGTLLEYTDCLQVDAAINPGNSGGPLFDAEARVIGINGRGSFQKRGRVNVGVGYAISSNQLKNFIGYLKSGRLVDHATLGARVTTDENRQVVVDDILDDSDASRRGLRYGDQLVKFGGRPMSSVNAFKNVLGIYPRDWRVPLSFRHGETTVDTSARLRGMHSEVEMEKLLASVQGPKRHQGPPRGGKPPKEKKSKDKPKEKPPENPEDEFAAKATKDLPEIVKQHYIARSGYVNYYFNQFEQDRLWKAFEKNGDFHAANGEWRLSGTAAMGGEWRFTLGADVAQVDSPGGTIKIDPRADLSGKLDPPGSGGLLVALSAWRRLLVETPAKFGSVYYVGTAPLAGHEGLCDVLSATYGGVETRFYFDPANGRLLSLEMYSDENEDPCEIAFDDYQTVDGRLLPRKLVVRSGDNVYLTLAIDRQEFSAAKPE